MEHLRFSFSTEYDLCAVMVYIASTYTIQYKQCVFQSSCWMLVGSLVVTYVDCTHHIGWTRAPPEFQAVDLPNFAPSTRAHSAHLVIHTHIHSARRCIHQMWLLHAPHLCSIINWKKKTFPIYKYCTGHYHYVSSSISVSFCHFSRCMQSWWCWMLVVNDLKCCVPHDRVSERAPPAVSQPSVGRAAADVLHTQNQSKWLATMKYVHYAAYIQEMWIQPTKIVGKRFKMRVKRTVQLCRNAPF